MRALPALLGALLPSAANAATTKRKDLASALLGAVTNAGTACDDWIFKTGTVRTSRWAPSPLLLTGALTLDVEHVSIRLTNVGSSTVDVDDVYVDPYRRG